jgi:hypothetical protein
MTGFPSSSQRFQYINFKWPAQSGFKYRLVRGSGAFAMHIVGFWFAVVGCGAITLCRSLAVPDMNDVIVSPDFKIMFVCFNKFIQVIGSFYCNFLLKCKPVSSKS